MTARRVLVFNHFAAPRGHPGGTRHVELFSNLPGWSHVIIASRLNLATGNEQLAEPGFLPVRVIPYRRNGISRVLNWVSYAVTATLAGLRQPRPDIVYASSPHLLAALAGWCVATMRRSRFILEIRDLWPRVLADMGQLTQTSLTYRALVRLERFLYARADAIVVLATGTTAALESQGVPADKVAYLPNGADPDDFRPSAPRDELRRRYGFSRMTAVYAGAHGPANGLDLLLTAARSVSDLDLEIVLIGSGVDKPRLVKAALDQGITNVRFMDPVSKVEIPDVLNAADIGLHVLADVGLFRDAVSPNKVFDYLATGLPVITNTPGVVGDLVTESSAGYVTAPDDLAQGLRRMYTTAATQRQAMGSAGRDWIARHQSRTATAGELLRLLTTVTMGEGHATVTAQC
jgi:glycosyltransferase involved in cell wall biosynthesis